MVPRLILMTSHGCDIINASLEIWKLSFKGAVSPGPHCVSLALSSLEPGVSLHLWDLAATMLGEACPCPLA